MKIWKFCTVALLLGSLNVLGQNDFRLGVLKYRGGGDYYVNPSAVRNLAGFANKHLPSTIDADYDYVEPGSPALFDYPWIHMTGHGNVVWNEQEERNLRMYLEAGGFLHIDDNYGMDSYVRREIKQLFPDKELQAVGPGHAIYDQVYRLPEGLPKIHEHDGKPPEAWAIYHQGRIVLLYTHGSDLGDGWEDPSVHNDPPEKRKQALQMGLNILAYAFLAAS